MSIASYGTLLDLLRGVRWPTRRVVAGSLPGMHRSRLRGTSPEFTEYRPYRQGDDPRRVDWKLLARSDRAFIRLADDRSIVPTLILVDASASMAWPVETREKWVQACRLAVGLAAVAHAGGDPVGLLVPTAHGVARVAPRTRRGVVQEVAAALDAVRPEGNPALADALTGVAPAARVVVVSDFLGDAPALLRAARECAAAGAEVHAVHVVADAELAPSPVAVLAVDPESAATRRPLTTATRDGYLRAFAEWREALARDWLGAGAGYTLVTTGEPADRAVRRVTGPVREGDRS
ncbi:MAG TPA: DUF58 domain-containing protein [Gemmatimonadaceae bacterium]|nr:DUF58 domain-containing protein [Gemmatimonadaceae bacterium]